MTVRVAIVGATGYGGAELVRILSAHPAAEIVAVTSGRKAGETVVSQVPWLDSELSLTAFDPAVPADVVFLAQESGFAKDIAGDLLARGRRVIDLSADFRLADPVAHAEAYGFPRPELSDRALYGLPELAPHDAYEGVTLVANPGCHPTAAGLALAPLVHAGLLSGVPVIDSMTGVSGAGRARTETAYTFSELSGSFGPYKPTGHRHVPEIEQVLGGIRVRFTPHLMPVARGMVAACHAPVLPGLTPAHLQELYAEFFRFDRFVRLVPTMPTSKATLGSNRCDVGVALDERTRMVVAVAALDNLGKGAAGQAVQNMNLMMGLDEGLGLSAQGVWP